MAEKWLTKIKWQIQIKNIITRTIYDELKAICTKFQEESSAIDMQVKTLLRELAMVYKKDIDDYYDIDWEV